jgi:hypothetical protein
MSINGRDPYRPVLDLDMVLHLWDISFLLATSNRTL